MEDSENYSVFHRFRQAKFDYGGSILNLSQFLLLPQLPQKVEFTSKVVKVDSKITVSLVFFSFVLMKLELSETYVENFEFANY